VLRVTIHDVGMGRSIDPELRADPAAAAAAGGAFIAAAAVDDVLAGCELTGGTVVIVLAGVGWGGTATATGVVSLDGTDATTVTLVGCNGADVGGSVSVDSGGGGGGEGEGEGSAVAIVDGADCTAANVTRGRDEGSARVISE
jgi:hypothetical protein